MLRCKTGHWPNRPIPSGITDPATFYSIPTYWNAKRLNMVRIATIKANQK